MPLPKTSRVQVQTLKTFGFGLRSNDTAFSHSLLIWKLLMILERIYITEQIFALSEIYINYFVNNSNYSEQKNPKHKSLWSLIAKCTPSVLVFGCWLRYPSIYNIIRWVAWTMGQTNRRPSIWCSKYFFFSWFFSKFFAKILSSTDYGRP